MKVRNTVIALSLLFTGLAPVAAWAEDGHGLPQGATFSTLIKTPLNIEGLTGDNSGNLYVPGRQLTAGAACPVWRVNIDKPVLVVVGFVPAPSPTGLCAPLGLAFDQAGMLYVTETDKIYRFLPNAGNPPTATLFASGVLGTNGLAFDRDGNLWTGDGTTGVGRVWRIAPNGVVTEAFRIQPMANEVNLVGGVGGVGRDVRDLPPGTITVTPTTRNAANTAGSQPLVSNGLAFDDNGDLFVADTARGAIWRVTLDRDGNVQSKTGCDTTFTANTLCLENIFVAHPLLEGADGIALDRSGKIWVDANERNAVIVVTQNGKDVIEVFRNAPDATTKLRNTGPLEFNTSPFLSDHKFCTTSSDANRRDNSPNTAGEIDNTAPPAGGPNRGKISCMNQSLSVPGVELPVR
ncbi:MAG TPA: SMP-30/gluconolactonase/LRE family protein [Burkholderiales bacterium]|nr:SMP-30/gluconolactonase/LRE family protein [Burkholderiales bacterium]